MSSTLRNFARRVKRSLRTRAVNWASIPQLSIEGTGTLDFIDGDLCAPCRTLSTHMAEVLRNPTIAYDSTRFFHGVFSGSSCPLCRFLGFTTSLDGTWNDYKSPSLDIFLKFHLTHYAYTFTPGMFLVYIDSGGSKLYNSVEYRKILPLVEDRIAAKPAPPYRPLRPDVVDFSIFQAWITNCEKTHDESCSLPTQSLHEISNFRLIDCETAQVREGSVLMRYAALSYVWGLSGAEVAQTTDEPFPRTIQDSITAARCLGFRYLWVDRYCIDQSNAMEVHQQISKMNFIYQNASLTIVAAAGASSNYGLPGVRPNSRCPQPTLVIQGTTWVSILSKPSETVSASKWSKRAWTFQEGLFSRRRLIFTEEQVIFQCNTSSCCELADPDPKVAPYGGELDRSMNRTWPADLFASRKASIVYPDESDHQWVLDRIQGYSKRELTFQADVLNALGGLFSSLANNQSYDDRELTMMAPYHYWGIPLSVSVYMHAKEDPKLEIVMNRFTKEKRLYAIFGCGLSWIRAESHLRHGPPATRRGGFPSWSWAGWIAPVTWRRWPRLTWRRQDVPTAMWMHTVDGRYEPLNTAAFDHLLHTNMPERSLYTCRLAIELDIIDVNLCYQDSGDFEVIADVDILPDSNSTLKSKQLHWPVALTPGFRKGDVLHNILCTETFQCLVMFGHYGLIVRTMDGISERLGIIALDANAISSGRAATVPSRLGTRKREAEGLKHKDLCLVKRFPVRKGRILLE
ncbi:heterokaryon incompatibility protein-domain-containing protein [Paraphoma chrysanthemicola]|nr:heterokaryon incompatibility protein-domain-containing protein [Paraphoma chrysanthemicola]